MKPLTPLFLALALSTVSAAQTPNQNAPQFPMPMPPQATQAPRSAPTAAPQPNVSATNAQTSTQTPPCAQQPAGTATKHINWKPPKSLQNLWDQEKKQIQNKTGFDIGSMPNADSLKTTAKPCPPATPPQSAAVKPPAPPAPTTTATLVPLGMTSPQAVQEEAVKQMQQRCAAAVAKATAAVQTAPATAGQSVSAEDLLKQVQQACSTSPLALPAATTPKN